ncbi:MAG: hypothetical protein NVS4B12_11790 [Ktedonobacteraceae bacterium]
MQVIFAGGASGVGASCLAIELADQWIVVDAGVRVDRKADPLPDLALLEGKNVRAIFVTHAHADHIGALPLIHQAFPNAPIFASRATGLLMEVMLADALKIMTRRAVEEMELPLFPQEMVASMLNMVRPLPIGESITLAELPGVTVHASRAGHIAGAISLAFKAPDGSLVVSGDISITPQRTVLGAVAPPMKSCDLLVLESTYGARLHPNRQGEEQRLAQAVADGLARGGHVLIPCFGLGRGQELVLLLQSAQDKGQIPQFPIYVDGLVRRVCSTYLLLPEALTPTLQRQIRKGYAPFTGPNVSFVRDERDRERILAGTPACIVSSSGMLTGGPSVWYAERLVSNPNASILITGYQDEEAPGRKLLDLAEQKKNMLELNGSSFQVQCQVAKYSLSAHADGGELASFAASVHPKQVALVHGDEEARLALRSRLTDTEVLLPANGSTLAVQHGRTKRAASKASSTEGISLSKLPIGISNGRTFEWKYVEELWHAVTQVPSLRIVTARELALVWYGQIVQDAQDEEVLEGLTRDIMYVLAEDYEQKYFVRQSALTEAYRVRGQREETPQDFITDLVGQLFLLQVSFDSTKPALCRAIEPVASVRVSLPKSVSSERTRYPLSALLDLLGPVPQGKEDIPHGVLLEELVRAARRIRRTISPHAMARQCRAGASYTLGEMCDIAGVSAQLLEERLAVAKVLHKYPRLFMPKTTFMEGEGTALYCLAPEWQEALLEPEEQTRPDQHGILTIIERHIGSPPDLYKRSVDPETGDVTLAFHFPDVAWLQYKDALEDAAEEAGIMITIAPNAHQGMLTAMARKVLPQGLSTRGAPSLYPEHRIIQLTCGGQVAQEAIAEAQERFHEKTGWNLQLLGDFIAKSATEPEPSTMPFSNEAPPPTSAQKEAAKKRFNQQLALQVAQHELSKLPGYYKTGADVNNAILIPRFYFPDVAQTRYADVFNQIETKTGWSVRLYPNVNQEALADMALQVLPETLTSTNTPSMYLSQRIVSVTCSGTSSSEEIASAKQRFEEETGWQLEILLAAQPGPTHVVTQDEAMAMATAFFSDTPDFYRVGVDTTRKVIWLHFHFPDAARNHYAQQFLDLETQTGWHVDLHPNANQKALVEVARRLLPEAIGIVSKSLRQETKTLHLTCVGSMSHADLEAIQTRFTDETGWRLDVVVTMKGALYS